MTKCSRPYVLFLLATFLLISCPTFAAASAATVLAVWQSAYFIVLAVVLIATAIAEIFVWRLHVIRKKDLKEREVQLQMMQLQDKALRAQMNPHFVFNCLNSIKTLVQEKRNDEAVNYLTTFTKLLRALLQHADKTSVSLYDELETCRLYLELESLRFGGHFFYSIEVQHDIDLKSFVVPALILQPIVENAIWHGLMPKKEKGNLKIAVIAEQNKLVCLVDDDGIGRGASKAMQEQGGHHQSKGVQLTTERMDLYSRMQLYGEASVQITDKLDNNGKAMGTRVELTFSIN